MQTRTFTARSFAEALAKVKADLGDGAVILKSEKRATQSAFGLGSREIYEVTAALSTEVKADLASGTEFANELSVKLRDENTERRSPGQNYEMSLLRSEVAALRDQLGGIAKHFKYNNLPAMPEQLSKSLTQMAEAGIEQELATDLTAEALVQLGPNELNSPEQITQFVIGKFAKIAPPAVNRPVARSGKPYKIAFVGSPGAGKTSTLQKLATDPKGYSKQKIGLISLDTHRLAAIEQIRTFARVSGLPLEIVYSPKDVSTALAKLAGCHLIMIDTAGCAPNETQRLDDLTHMLEALQPDETHLVLNATARSLEQSAVARRFQQVGITHLSLTRLDESEQPGALVTISNLTKKPLAWLASGQNFVGQLERYRPDWLRTHVFHETSRSTAGFVPLKKTTAHA
ncbi:MAG: hypothetical protein IPG71_08805 [bacterium]|nr:hypothetical protein [bacterium]